VGSKPAARANIVTIIYLIGSMNKIVNYIKESYQELTDRVTWPTMTELQNFTTIVLVSLAVITIVVLAMDKLSEFGIIDLYYNNI